LGFRVRLGFFEIGGGGVGNLAFEQKHREGLSSFEFVFIVVVVEEYWGVFVMVYWWEVLFGSEVIEYIG